MGCSMGHASIWLGYVPWNFLVTYPKILVHVLMTGGIATYTKCTCVGLVHVNIGFWHMILGHIPNCQDMYQTCINLVYVKTVCTYRNTIGICPSFGTCPKCGKPLGHVENVGTCRRLLTWSQSIGTLDMLLAHVLMYLRHVNLTLGHMSQFEKICRAHSKSRIIVSICTLRARTEYDERRYPIRLRTESDRLASGSSKTVQNIILWIHVN